MSTLTLKERMLAALAASAAARKETSITGTNEVKAAPSSSLPDLKNKEPSALQIEISQDGEVTIKEEKEELLSKSEIGIENLNERQRLAVTLASSGKSFVLIGSAGSGKTTTQRVILQTLLREGKLGTLDGNVNSKHLSTGMPAVLITSFTKVATRNIREAAPLEFKKNCVNIHKAVEFAPTEVLLDSIGEDGLPMQTESMRFTPQKNRFDPLAGVRLCIVEEAGSLDVELFLQLADALPSSCTYIFLGDLNQLPPVYGAAILGFAINKLPVVELTEVYRQNIGPIKELASRILEGKRIPPSALMELAESSREGAILEMNFFTSKKKNKTEEGFRLNKGLGDYMKKEVLAGRFKEGKSIVLTPIRKATNDFLTIFEINKHIAGAFSSIRGSETYEIKSRSISGGTHYYAVGDLVFFEREYYKVKEIRTNHSYINSFGMDFKQPSTTLNRWGVDSAGDMFSLESDGEDSLDTLLEGEIENFLRTADDAAEAKNLISHRLYLEQWDVEEGELPMELIIETPGDLEALTLGYAQTIHSSQGSEWDNVYLLAPDNVGFMYNREMLYTGVTRARTRLTIWCEDGTKPYNIMKGTFEAGIKRQAIKGDSLREKRKFFLELGREKTSYEAFPLLLESLNMWGVLPIEDYYSLDSNNALVKIDKTLPF